MRPELLSLLPSLQIGCREISCVSVSASTSFIFLTSESSTLVLKSQGGQLTEVLDPLAAFFVEGPTINAFSVNLSETETVLVQVTKSGIFILSSTGHSLYRWDVSELPSFSQRSDMDIDDNDLYSSSGSKFTTTFIPLISFASHCGGYLSIILENGSLIVFSIKSSTYLNVIFDSTDSNYPKLPNNTEFFKSCEIFYFDSEYILAVYQDFSNPNNLAFYHLPTMNCLWATCDISNSQRILSHVEKSTRMPELSHPSTLVEFSVIEGYAGTAILLLRYALDSLSDFSFFSIYYCKNFVQVFTTDNLNAVFIKLEHQIFCNSSFPIINKSFIPLGSIGSCNDTLHFHGIMILGSHPHCLIFSKSSTLLVDSGGDDKMTPSCLPVLIEVNFPDGSRPLSLSPISLSHSSTFLTLNYTPNNILLMICKAFPTGACPFFNFPDSQTIIWERKALNPKPGLTNADKGSKIISMLRYDPESGCILAVIEKPAPFIIPPTEAELASTSQQTQNDLAEEVDDASSMIPMTTPITSSCYLELISPISWLIIDRYNIIIFNNK